MVSPSNVWMVSSNCLSLISRSCDRPSFEPQLIPKHQTRWAGFEDKIISLYARGMTVREIQAHLEEMYGTEVSPSLISSVTDAVADEVKAWQARPLEPIYPIVYLDCIHVKVRGKRPANPGSPRPVIRRRRVSSGAARARQCGWPCAWAVA